MAFQRNPMVLPINNSATFSVNLPFNGKTRETKIKLKITSMSTIDSSLKCERNKNAHKIAIPESKPRIICESLFDKLLPSPR